MFPEVYPDNSNRAADIASIAFIFIYALGYSMGFGPAAWVYGSEVGSILTKYTIRHALKSHEINRSSPLRCALEASTFPRLAVLLALSSLLKSGQSDWITLDPKSISIS